MRYINIKENPPDDWLKKSNEITTKLKEVTTDIDRKKIINDNSEHWKELKKWLEDINFGKCWYSEAKELVSDYHVDHFRPKGKVVDIDKKEIAEGYWWLAFDWKNYRISGAICNSPHKGDDGITKGKWDYFPLHNNLKICKCPTDDIEDEIYLILDPCNEEDVSLICFDESGYPFPTNYINPTEEEKKEWEYIRVEQSIKILHLDYHKLINARKELWNECKMKINEYINDLKMYNENPSSTKKERLKNRLNEIKKYTERESQLSATAIACVLSEGDDKLRRLIDTKL
jgi:hypothetical protein